MGRPLILAAVVVSLTASLPALAACGDDEEADTTTPGATGPTGATGPASAELREQASIDPATGVAAGLEPDARDGDLPGRLPHGELETLAEEAGCELMLDLPDEGNTHLRPGEGTPDYDTDPPIYSEQALAAIAAFRDRFRGKGPERVPL
jgi:hypothetical protein